MTTGAGTAVLNEAQLEAWGRSIGAAVETPVVFALRGDLGAGKSVFARSVARGAGVEVPMPSPTYNLLFQYSGSRATIYHLDLYRLDDPDEVWEIGWSELGEGDQIVLVEWPERAEALLPHDRWEIRIEAPSAGASVREVTAHRLGAAPPIPLPEAAVQT